MSVQVPEMFPQELINRFYTPVLDLIERELDRGADNTHLAMLLSLLATLTAESDPATAKDTLALLAEHVEAAIEVIDQ